MIGQNLCETRRACAATNDNNNNNNEAPGGGRALRPSRWSKLETYPGSRERFLWLCIVWLEASYGVVWLSTSFGILGVAMPICDGSDHFSDGSEHIGGPAASPLGPRSSP